MTGYYFDAGKPMTSSRLPVHGSFVKEHQNAHVVTYALSQSAGRCLKQLAQKQGSPQGRCAILALRIAIHGYSWRWRWWRCTCSQGLAALVRNRLPSSSGE